ncbi:unnamed protein product [Cladocopium goreaui]|uniref:Tubulin beta chain (Beta-tubulin) n=1 Tax=Cladocopium goreaui TaxID=2562237 RepID=A0A9P1BW81_9DINO|nr:unnamed protein product [Cladocopium goreaui]
MSRSSRVVRVARVVFVGFLVALLVKWAPLDFSVARKGTAPAALQAAPELGFGKYSEKTILDVVNEDPDYCRWIVDTYNSAPDDCTEKLKIAAEWIQENNPEINEGRLMGFGKHRSETMEWVYENEQDYTAWVMSKFKEADNDHSGKLAAFARYVLERQENEE